MLINYIKIILAAAGLCGSCASGDITDLSPLVFQQTVENDPLAVIIDARTPGEYAEGHIQGAILMDVNNPVEFEKDVAKLDKNKHYYIYCRSGKRSLVAAHRLHNSGFKVFNMKGGILAWQEDDLPIVK